MKSAPMLRSDGQIETRRADNRGGVRKSREQLAPIPTSKRCKLAMQQPQQGPGGAPAPERFSSILRSPGDLMLLS